MNYRTEPLTIVLIALYRYQNFPIRLMHSLLEKIDGVEPHTIFFQNFYTNALKLPTAKEEDLLRKKIIELQPRVVGMSVYSPFARIAKRLTGIIKNNSSALVLWGGIHPTLSPETCLQEADAVCIGEGEGALVDLVRTMGAAEGYQQVENLWIKNDRQILKNPMRPLIQDLDALPFPAYARDTFYFIGSNQITGNDPTLLDPILQIMPARGCPFACSYCVNSLLRPMYRGLGHYTRRRSAFDVVNEIKEILNTPGNRKSIVEFHDENFGTDASWLADFEALYKKEINLPFKVQYNPTLVKPETIHKLARLGLHRVKFGIEAGTDNIRNTIFQRPGKNRDIAALVSQISNDGVKIRYDLILDNPYDTEETLKETIELVLQLPKPLRFNLYSLQYFPHYPLTQRALNDGHIKKQEVSLSSLQKRMARNWAFVPKLFPYSKKQMLQNILWLYIHGHTGDKQMKYAAFQESCGATLYLHYLNFIAILRGKYQAIKRLTIRK